MTADIAAGVTRTLALYAAAVDARDPARITAVLALDVKLTRNDTTVEGVKAFIEAYRPFLDSDIMGSRHVVTNHIVEVTGADSATVHSTFEATFFDADRTRRVMGRYDDDLAERDGEWVITHKRNTIEWSLELPAATRL